MAQNNGVLIVAETLEGGLAAVSFELLAAGRNATGDFVVETSPQMATIRPRSIDPSPAEAGRNAEVVPVQAPPPEQRARVVAVNRDAGGTGPKLSDAKAIVSGGRGLGGPEN